MMRRGRSRLKDPMRTTRREAIRKMGVAAAIGGM
jgi:hypothetical protein